MNELEQAKAIFLTEEDPDELEFNRQKIAEWEQSLMLHEAFQSWREQDITIRIAKQARDTFRDIALILAANRTLTEEQRKSLYAKQDACTWLLSIIEVDAKGALENVKREIATALGKV